LYRGPLCRGDEFSRDTADTNGKVSNTSDVNSILNQQADTMLAVQAAGQVVARPARRVPRM
jgi:hypothetical protein